MSDKEWQRVTRDDKNWQRVVKQMIAGYNEWQLMILVELNLEVKCFP